MKRLCFKIFYPGDFLPEHLDGRILDVRNQQTFNSFSAIRAFERERASVFLEITELGINLVQQSRHRESARFGVSRHLAKHDRGTVPIFISHEVGTAVTVAFFAAEDVERRM